MGASSSLLRRVKNPTATGMRSPIMERQSSAKPKPGAIGWEVVCPPTVVSIGVPLMPMIPQTQRKKLGQAQNNAVPIVAMRPTVFLSIKSSFLKIIMSMSQYIKSVREIQAK
jgi:hypothetical protein